MKIIRTSEVPNEERNGYSIKRLFTEALDKCEPSNIGLYQTTIPPGSKCPCHAHNQLQEILLFLTPSKMIINGADYRLYPKDYVILEPGESHEIIADGKEDVVLVAMKIPNITSDRAEPKG